MRELAAGGVPVTVTCRVLKLAGQPYYRWLDKTVADDAVEQAYRANALSFFEVATDRVMAVSRNGRGPRAVDRGV